MPNSLIRCPPTARIGGARAPAPGHLRPQLHEMTKNATLELQLKTVSSRPTLKVVDHFDADKAVGGDRILWL
jgi:hypothetical protein